MLGTTQLATGLLATGDQTGGLPSGLPGLISPTSKTGTDLLASKTGLVSPTEKGGRS